MPVKPYAAYKLSVTGFSASSQDWSFGLWFTSAASAPTAADMNAWAVETLAPTSTFFNAIKGLMGTDTQWIANKTYYYPPGVAKASVVGDAPLVSPVLGTVSSPQSPFQVALVVSLLTGLAGATHKGRCYLPCNAPLLSGRQLGSSDTLALASASSAWVNSLNALEVVGTITTAVVAGHAAATPIVSTRVDSRMDIQRRRTDKIAPVYTTTIPL
jgi:hypothetical protein